MPSSHRVKVVKCGNSLVVSIPAGVVSFLGLKTGDTAMVELRSPAELVYSFKVNRQLKLIPFKKTRKSKAK